MLTALLGGLASCADIPFTCSENAQCVLGDQVGICEPNRRCSFEYDKCPSGRRYARFGTGEACVPVPPVCRVAGVSAGANFACAWFRDGRAACWGDNGSGQLGDGTTTSRSSAKPVDGLAGAAELIAAGLHSCVRRQDGELVCWGDNQSGQLGIGMSSMRAPVTAVGLKPKLLALGARHTCAVGTDDALVCWGRNDRGQLGDGTMMNRPSPAAVMGLAGRVLDVGLGESHSCARLEDDSVWCWGSNRLGALLLPADMMQSGRPVRMAGVPAGRLAAGDGHTCVLDAEGGVTCWGHNSAGQVSGVPSVLPLEPTRVADLRGATAIAAGGQQSCALNAEGALRCWGNGWSQALGNARVEGTRGNPVIPGGAASVAMGMRHACALSRDGEVFCWGRAPEGQLGDDSQFTGLPPAEVRGVTDAVAVTAGTSHSCALSKAGKVVCWGHSEQGQAGPGAPWATEPRAIALPSPAVQIVAGGDFACARLDSGDVACWGDGRRGQLGEGASSSRDRAVIVALAPEKAAHVAAGDDHACAVTTTGAVFCWGEKEHGRLGNGVLTMGVQNRPVRVPLMDADGIVRVTAGGSHSCALGRTGRVWCWGQSSSGQAGSTVTPAPITLVEGMPEAIEVVAGVDHTCALAKEGTVHCWGKGDVGQLGWGTATQGLPQPLEIPKLNGVVAIDAGSQHSCALRTDGTVLCWGSNRFGQLAVTPMRGQMPAVPGVTGPTAIATGDRHSCAVTSRGTVMCWGSHQQGQLGTGMPLSRAEPRKVAVGCP